MKGCVLKVHVDNRIRMALEALPVEVRRDLEAAFTYPNPERAKAFRARLRWAHKLSADVWTWDVNATPRGNEFSIPRGGMSRLREVLTRHGVVYETVDDRCNGKSVNIKWARKYEPRSFQIEMEQVGMQLEQMLTRSTTGSGKTVGVLNLIQRIGQRALVVVQNKSLLKQWTKEVKKWFGLKVGVIAGSKREVRDITIGMQQTLSKCMDDYAKVFGVVVVDEVHRCAAPTFLRVADVSHARYRFGVSDDERRKDGKDFLIRDMFSDVAVEVNERELYDQKVIVEVDVELIETEFVSDTYRMFRDAERRLEDAVHNLVDPDPEDLAYVAKHAQRAFVNLVAEMSEDEGRNLLGVVWLAEKMTDARTRALVMGERRDHMVTMRSVVNVHGKSFVHPRELGLALGGNNDAVEFDRTIAGLSSGKIRIGFGTFQAVGTGIDVPELTHLLAMTPLHTNKSRFRQGRGRLCRPSEVRPCMGHLWDRRVFGDAQVRAIARWNKNTYVRFLDGTRQHAKEYLRGR